MATTKKNKAQTPDSRQQTGAAQVSKAEFHEAMSANAVPGNMSALMIPAFAGSRAAWTTQQAVTQQAAAAWADLQDPWALLNASPETIRAAAAASGQTGLEDLLRLLEAIREMLTVVGGGDLFTPEGEPCEGKRVAWERFWEAERAVWEVRSKYYGSSRPGLMLTPRGMGLTLYHHLGQVDIDRLGWQFDLFTESVFAPLEAPLNGLLKALETATPSTVFVCERCGRIGPAERSDKRYCNNVCRAQASRQRRP